ncbi:hypothetical protein E0L93_11180 [Rubrobacter taiwanensis]|jgi:hypothetical protein|uniref:Uncharacterized protein n=1 Tax=Rubrobacter taiwanensis TaxID=185139 RepID=A0A4R1BFU1_9ACTN|nr:hypothetical protein [Rubrobacter taiwanensis]TCJ16039.1 hypothetical protein E0L93_11180 [Rubrobacter taiwanensis]
MRGGNTRRKGVRPGRPARLDIRPDVGKIAIREQRLRNRQAKRQAERNRLYRRRRSAALGLVLAVTLVLLAAAFAQNSGSPENYLPIDPNAAGPDTVIAGVDGVEISIPVRPANLTGLGYHPDGEHLLELEPRGKDLSASPLARIFFGGSTPEGIGYYIMEAAGRPGPATGALDVGAEAGTPVYSPVTGTVTAIRPDPVIPEAFVIEIKPADRPDLRVMISGVRELNSPEGGVDAPVTAGMTELGAVADSTEVLKPQLASYVSSGSGNHVTITAVRVG